MAVTTTDPIPSSSSSAPTSDGAYLKTELDRLGDTGRWLCTLFVVTALPNIMTGYHMNSYVFVGEMPADYWCEGRALHHSGWTADQRRQISAPMDAKDKCSIADLDYNRLGQMSFEKGSMWAQTHQNRSEKLRCLADASNASMQYQMDGSSIVTEWDLVCERSFWRTAAQMGVSLGKAVGAISTGILSDRYGRRTMYVAGACVYTVSSALMAASPWYWGFLLGRFMVGLASSMIFYPSAVMMAENVAPKHRFWLTMVMHYVYPISMVYLAGAAYWLRSWRDLQLALTLPAGFLLVNIFFFHESPRWLISKGRLGEAHRILFGETNKTNKLKVNNTSCKGTKSPTPTATIRHPTSILHVFITLYGRAKHRRVMLICHFIYMTSSFSYYVSVINSANLAANPTVYVLGTALVDAIADTLNLLVLRNVGRRYNLGASLAGAACSYSALLLIPNNPTSNGLSLLVLAMLARMCICSAYSIIELYVVELFPTEVRSSAVGFCSTLAHCASVSAPFVVDFAGGIAWHWPTTMCAGMLLVAAGLVMLSPETSKTDLEDFAADAKDAKDDGDDDAVTTTRL